MVSLLNLCTVSLLALYSVSLNCLNADAARNAAVLQETDSRSAAGRRFRLSLDGGDVALHPDLIEKRSPSEIHVSASGEGGSDFDTNNSQSVQQMTDFILNLVRSQIILQNKRQIEIPDIHKSTCKGLGYLCVTIAFNATGGWFRDLSSIRRVGEVKFSRQGENIITDFGIGLRTMQFGYNRYKLKLGPVQLSGEISGEMGLTAISVKFSVDVGRQTCSILLLDTKISHVGEPNLRLTGMGKLNSLYSKIMTWVANRSREDAVATAEGILQKTIEDVFERLRCEEEANDVGQ